MKNPSNYPIKCFALIKKITSRTFIIAGALIVIIKGLSSEMEGSIKVVSINRSPLKRWRAQFFLFIKGPVYN